MESIKIFIRVFRDKYWIRRDRDNVFWSGVMLACMVASIVTTYWHYFDMTELKPKIKLKTKASKMELKKIEDAGFMLPLQRTSTFYKIEEYFKPE